VRNKQIEKVSAGKLLREAKENITAYLEELASETDRARADEGFNQLLNGMAHLWRYSFFNQSWIRDQMKNATAVMGPRQWERIGRKVKSKARPILVAVPYYPNKGWPLIPVEVFDISQTKGKLYTHIKIDPDDGECPMIGQIIDASVELGIPIGKYSEEVSKRPAEITVQMRKTYGLAIDDEVLWDDRQSSKVQAEALIHEYAHIILKHTDRKKRDLIELLSQGRKKRFAETEAEATAYVVLKALGFSSNAPGYIAWHRGSGELILSSLKRIQTAARKILSAVENAGRNKRDK